MQKSLTLIFLHSLSDEPGLQLAADEFVLKNMNEDVCMLWTSRECVIIGKHQLPWSEVNVEKLMSENIPLLRRISGGGTVYNGPGNFNFSFITSEHEHQVNFRKYAKPIIGYLQSIGIQSSVTGKSNISVQGLKFSGNAASVHRKRSLHHGTLLFNVDCDRISYLLSSDSRHYGSKAVPSVRAEITSLKSYLPNMQAEAFISGFKNYLIQSFGIVHQRRFTEEEEMSIRALWRDKYTTFDWNYGYSPDFTVSYQLQKTNPCIKISLLIKQARVFSVVCENTENDILQNELQLCLQGIRFRRNDIHKALSDNRGRFSVEWEQLKNLIE